MSGRKRTKRKNSDEDFDVDEGDDGLDIDDINKWACHSCTFVNRAAAFRCFVCGTRKGTSTRRSRCNDNVVEMQKSITDMVQKQVEKEKSLKRKERSMLKSVPRDLEETTTEIKIEHEELLLDQPKKEISESPVSEQPSLSAIKMEVKEEPMKPPLAKIPRERKKRTPKASRESTPYVNGATRQNSVTPAKSKISRESTPQQNGFTSGQSELIGKALDSNPTVPGLSITGLPLNILSRISDVKIEVTPEPQPAQRLISTPSTSSQQPPAPEVTKTFTPENIRSTKPTDDSILHHLPERVVRKLNQQLPYDYNLLKAQKNVTGIDPIVADSEAVLLPHDWDRQKVMKGLATSLGSSHNVSPTTSRQSSETDSSSSDGNRSFETPFNDAPSSVSKSCQIPDYMIHRDAPRKIFIVANGFPAFFEEFPRRI